MAGEELQGKESSRESAIHKILGGRMAIRGTYSDLEKQILESFEKEADTRQGWHRLPVDAPPFMRGEPIITAAVLKEYASGLDPWNPFWNLVEYAVATRWSSL